ncbi:MAG: MFS transporter [Patescibacteria group bacterium]|jgi:predicted MFS family arabinose efflux permease
MIASLIRKFIPRHLSEPLKDLYVNTALIHFGTSLFSLFEPIYFHKLGFSIAEILLFYGAFFALCFFMSPLGGKFVLRYGHQRSLILSSLLEIVYYASLFALGITPLALPIALIANAANHTFYWPAFHFEYAQFGRDQESGREVSARVVLEIIADALAPFLGGLILILSSFTVLFIVASLVMLLSCIPLLFDRTVIEVHHFPYVDAMRRMFSALKWRFVLAMTGNAELISLRVLWPLFLFLFLGSNPFTLGSLVGVSSLVTMLAVLYIGRLADHKNKRSILKPTTLLYALSWWLRPFLPSLGGIFIADMSSRLTHTILQVPQLALVYERGRSRHHTMRTAVLYEMSTLLGRLLFIAVAFSIFIFFSTAVAWPMVFVLTGFVSLLYLLQ